MNVSNSSSPSILSAFPVVYGGAFVFTLTNAVINYCNNGLPMRVKTSLPHPGDQSVALTCFVLFAIAVSFFVFFLYVRLELFEHKPDIPTPQQLGAVGLYLEYILRLIIVLVITLKLMQWSDYSSLLEFQLVLTICFGIWIFLLKKASYPLGAWQLTLYILLPIMSAMLIFIEKGNLPSLLTIILLTIFVIVIMLCAFIEGWQVIKKISQLNILGLRS